MIEIDKFSETIQLLGLIEQKLAKITDDIDDAEMIHKLVVILRGVSEVKRQVYKKGMGIDCE